MYSEIFRDIGREEIYSVAEIISTANEISPQSHQINSLLVHCLATLKLR